MRYLDSPRERGGFLRRELGQQAPCPPDRGSRGAVSSPSVFRGTADHPKVLHHFQYSGSQASEVGVRRGSDTPTIYLFGGILICISPGEGWNWTHEFHIYRFYRPSRQRQDVQRRCRSSRVHKSTPGVIFPFTKVV